MSIRNLDSVYGAEANPTGDPIGGGAGYRRVVRQGDHAVANAEEFLAALKQAKPGQVVYVAPDAKIDLSGHVGIQIPAGVTLAGNRGADGSPGPLLYNGKMPAGADFLSAGENARVTGLRIKGPDCNIEEINYDVVPRSGVKAIVARGPGVEVDNCEIANFHHSGVLVQNRNAHIHHCFIHDVHAYPVGTGGGAHWSTLIEANIIHWIWHCVAGHGHPGDGYEARYNLIIRRQTPKSWAENYTSHAWDVHNYRPASTAKPRRLIAGDRISIHHNTMQNTGPTSRSGLFRGVPREFAVVYNNWFSESNPEMGVRQVEPKGNVWVYNNVYGPEKALIPVGEDTTARVLFRRPAPPTENPEKVSGEFALDFEVSVLPGLQVKRVAVEVGGRELYAAARAPHAGEVVVNTRELANGIQELVVVVEDSRGVVSRQAVTLSVEN
ncbi:MAG: right-handed parallel beta-helix repeat-containing protein [Armatimonadetes bacterium]|nr:right-handed parallel beta-helix repeat-containing protein [Armatimonadota bacterium]